MFKMFSIITVLGALALVAVPLTAQTSAPQTATVPFSFFVGDGQLPAGDYTIREAHPLNGMISIGSATTRVFVLAHHETAKGTRNEGQLVFNKYPGDRYFLREVWYQGAEKGLAVPKSQKEREAVSSTLISGLRPERVVVLLAGN